MTVQADTMLVSRSRMESVVSKSLSHWCDSELTFNCLHLRFYDKELLFLSRASYPQATMRVQEKSLGADNPPSVLMCLSQCSHQHTQLHMCPKTLWIICMTRCGFTSQFRRRTLHHLCICPHRDLHHTSFCLSFRSAAHVSVNKRLCKHNSLLCGEQKAAATPGRNYTGTTTLLFSKCYNLCIVAAWKFSTLVRDNWSPVAVLLCLVA